MQTDMYTPLCGSEGAQIACEQVSQHNHVVPFKYSTLVNKCAQSPSGKPWDTSGVQIGMPSSTVQ